MNKRDAIKSLLALGTAPHAFSAQAADKLPTLAFLVLFNNPQVDLILQKLNERGWVEGKNILIERAIADGDPKKLSDLAVGLAQRKVDLIFALGPDASVYAARATKNIPILSYGTPYPVEQGLADSLARPGRNVTGVVYDPAYLKQLELIREILPKVKRVAQFHIPGALLKLDGGIFTGYGDRAEVARKLGFELKAFTINSTDDVEEALKSMKTWKAQAIITYATPLTLLAQKQILNFVNANKIVNSSDTRRFTDAGGLISYGMLLSEMRQQSSIQVDRMLRGTKPANLPMELPTKYELVINRKAADALGIKLSKALLLRADEVIG